MRGPSIQRTIAYSALLHMTFLALAVVMISYSRNVIMPSAYTVNLVNLQSGRSSGEHISGAAETAAKTAQTESVQKDSRKMVEKPIKSDDKRVKDKLSELEAKNKLVRSLGLKKKMAEISGKSSSSKSTARTSGKEGFSGGPAGSAEDRYIAKITEEIWMQWSWPDTGEKNLETIILVKINRDGSITVQGKEKSSGNVLFDRLALKALAKATPVTPPPYEMEIGIKFYP